MDIDAYFRRIGYRGPRAATLPVLREITRLHPMAIAFENLAVAAGGVPDVDLPAVAAKLLGGGRGGYCYEHNTLLQAVLEALGFRTTALAARVRFRLPPDMVAARGHMILRVDLPEGPHIVDAGFGGLTLTGPVRLEHGTVQPTPKEDVRLVDAGGDWRLQARLEGAWADVYQFDESEHLPPDIVQMNWFTATRPNALFAHNVIATRPVEGGRHALFNQTLTFRAPGRPPERREVAGAPALAEVLSGVFGLVVPEAEVARAAEVAARAQGLNPSFS